MQKKMLIPVAIIAAGFWYWTTVGEGGSAEEELRLRENAKLIKDCIDRENSLNAAARKAGGKVLAVDSKALCEEKYNLYDSEGEWHQLNTNDNNVWTPR